MTTEADTCRKYVLPKLYNAGWTDNQISEQKTFKDGRIMVAGRKVFRKKSKRADYILKKTRDFPIAVVEAKAEYKNPGDEIVKPVYIPVGCLPTQRVAVYKNTRPNALRLLTPSLRYGVGVSLDK